MTRISVLTIAPQCHVARIHVDGKRFATLAPSHTRAGAFAEARRLMAERTQRYAARILAGAEAR